MWLSRQLMVNVDWEESVSGCSVYLCDLEDSRDKTGRSDIFESILVSPYKLRPTCAGRRRVT